MDRRDLQQELNRINQLFQEKDVELSKAGASMEQRQQLRDMLNNKKQRLMAEMGDSLQKLNAGEDVLVKRGTVSKGVDESNLPDVSKQVGLGKFGKTFSRVGRKAAGVIPLAGVGMAVLSGDPAMAAEELAEDAMGPLAALKPEAAGSAEHDAMIRSERDAQKSYMKSPAYRAARGIPEPTEEEIEDQDIAELSKPRKTPFSKLRSLFGGQG